ncbi:flagellar protein FlaG [Ureibacillus chungkukjangi]|uniref:Flagellar protein FlaG n=1 Tax=Ureibacillus chungkukjangi TaxID=1202712 RepID=A0A318TX90_9BACL|nr:flagellar protein FlaG [Ureibacillus chungkukjangi]PYF07628.1 flagellar protein FlaG [Ureibacillus chungkukjangi]
MRIENQSHPMNNVASMKSVETQTVKPENYREEKAHNSEVENEISTNQMKQAVDSINEIFEINNSELKFVFHEGLKEYFVQLVNSETEEVVREIPSKKLLDVFYEMQKLVGMIIDEKI